MAINIRASPETQTLETERRPRNSQRNIREETLSVVQAFKHGVPSAAIACLVSSFLPIIFCPAN
jgi:hypothetical protein